MEALCAACDCAVCDSMLAIHRLYSFAGHMQVDNHSSVARVHLIVDVSELPHKWEKLQPGQMCRYEKNMIVCNQ
jgi:hypothetical protein